MFPVLTITCGIFVVSVALAHLRRLQTKSHFYPLLRGIKPMGTSREEKAVLLGFERLVAHNMKTANGGPFCSQFFVLVELQNGSNR